MKSEKSTRNKHKIISGIEDMNIRKLLMFSQMTFRSKIPFKTQVLGGILWAKFDLRDSFSIIMAQMSGDEGSFPLLPALYVTP